MTFRIHGINSAYLKFSYWTAEKASLKYVTLMEGKEVQEEFVLFSLRILDSVLSGRYCGTNIESHETDGISSPKKILLEWVDSSSHLSNNFL